MAPELLTFAAALLAGGIASLSGFGIGSVLTPLLALYMPMRLAVAVVSLPHFIGTALRFWLLRRHTDRHVLKIFGIASAAGGLLGAVMQIWLHSRALGCLLAALLVFAGVMGATGAAQRLRFGKKTGWIAGLLSGMFGGLVGNQGGIRSAALMAQDMTKESLVATATAIALLVDVFRMPVYAATQYRDIAAAWPFLLAAAAGVVAGTFLGKPVLQKIPEKTYRFSLSLLILALGVWMFFHPGA